MRKDKKGRPAKIQDIKVKVKDMRKIGYSYTEIGQFFGISKQLAQYHGSYPQEVLNPLDKEMAKE